MAVEPSETTYSQTLEKHGTYKLHPLYLPKLTRWSLAPNGQDENQLEPSNLVENGSSISDPETDDKQPLQPHTVSFESFEHKSIGDAAMIQLDGQQIKGKDFNYIVGKNLLSYGDITALAGTSPHCPVAIIMA
jgi:hypothetical protein